jgi:hypothetical protein
MGSSSVPCFRFPVPVLALLIACGGGKKQDEWWREYGYGDTHGRPEPRPDGQPAGPRSDAAERLLAADDLLAAVDAIPAGELDVAGAPRLGRAAVALRLALLTEHRGDGRSARGWLAVTPEVPAALSARAAELRARPTPRPPTRR